ncbi:MAG: phosphoribosylamine--glycine ligase [Clostridiales bacterium]|nr:phosphoribosylamine--glycine ligase [Clostridiales bacterium]
MKVLVVGSGGREHVICWKLAQSARVDEIYCAPGNGGIAKIATCVPIKATEIDKLVDYAKEGAFDLVFVAPEDPLALGLVDRLEEAGVRAFGPSAAAAIVESSKAFSKNLMKKYNIPTAKYELFDDEAKAFEYLESQKMPIVIKCDGLALGKGVIIAQTLDEAKDAVRSMMEDKAFGDAGNTIVIEECMTGPELTILAFSDGNTAVPMVSSRDHKRAYDHDEGLNTGGMGAVTPGADLYPEDIEAINNKIIRPTIEALAAEGRTFKGVLYFGLMLTDEGAKVVEYNCRFGDPEVQAILPLLENDFMDVIDAVIDGHLADVDIRWKNKCSCVVVMASGGYPKSYAKGYKIEGIDTCGKIVFQAGTAIDGNGDTVTSGGRVLCVYDEGDTLDEAIDGAYEGVKKISFTDAHYRTDIGRTLGNIGHIKA